MKTQTDRNHELFGQILQAVIVRGGIDVSLGRLANSIRATYEMESCGEGTLYPTPDGDTPEELIEEANQIMDAVLTAEQAGRDKEKNFGKQ